MRRVAVFLIGVVLVFVGAAALIGSLTWHGGERRPVLAGLVILGVVAFLVVRGVRRFAEPLGDLMEAADRLAGGDYAARVSERGPRDVRRLGRAFNAMAERLQGDEERRRDLMADVTHELRTPLAVIQGNVEGMADGLYPLDEDRLGLILGETRVMARLLEDLQTLSTADAGVLRLHRQRVDAADVVREAVAAQAPAAAATGIRLEGDAAPELPALDVDPVRIGEVLANLLTNALRHTPAGGTIRVSASRDVGASAVAFVVADAGPGIPADELPHVFDRFAKGAGSRGTGLGLAIARSLVEAHGGTIGIESSSAGTRVRFTVRDPSAAG
jgi:two-component system, OmpR family, sensor histidine kinase BaeS